MHPAAPANTAFLPQPPSFFVPPRRDAQELLDMGVGSIQDVRANFADLWRINRYLGGFRALSQHLYPRLQRYQGPLTVVDIGAGSADIAVRIARWAQQRRIDVKLCGLDISTRHLWVARHNSSIKNNIHLIQADALHLPFATTEVDYFISSLFLHHFSPEQVIRLLARTFESARRGIIMSDIARGYLPLIAFKLGQPIFARNFLTQHDGIVSIRRAYTPAELQQLAQSAGLTNVRIYQLFPWRMTLVADK